MSPIQGSFFRTLQSPTVSAAPSSNIPQSFPTVGATELGGLVYRDFNANGTIDSQEPGFTTALNADAVTVTAYDDSNTAAGTTTTNSDGTWIITGLTASTDYRVEISGLPSYIQPGAHTDSASESLVSFATTGDNDVLTAVNDPSDWCQSVDQLPISANCYVSGDVGGGASGVDAFVTWTYDDTCDLDSVLADCYEAPAGADKPASIATHAVGSDIGSTWGSAWNSTTETYYLAAFMKRHVDIGPGGEGAIYEVDPVTNTVTTLYTVPAMTAIPRPDLGNPGDPSYDTAAFDAVGTTALGDIDIDEANQILYIVDLEHKDLVRYDIANGAALVPVAIPDPGCTGGQHRPFGVEFEDGLVYATVTCDASTSQLGADLDGYIMTYDGTTWATVPLQSAQDHIDMDYDAEIEFEFGSPINDEAAAPYAPWFDSVYADGNAGLRAGGYTATFYAHNQPLLADIEFDNDRSIALAVIDRTGHQYQPGNSILDVAETSAVVYSDGHTIGSGDLLRICYDHTAGSYNLEGTAAGCAQTEGQMLIGTGVASPEAPGTPVGNVDEYYNGDYWHGYFYTQNFAGSTTYNAHWETLVGGAEIVPGQSDIRVASIDPLTTTSGGVTGLDNATGDWVSGTSLYDRNDVGVFGKGAGIGDIETACTAAPLEIGNRVWVDTDADGVQDPSESPLSGVTVELFDGTSVIATAVTDADGNYIFTSWDYDVADAWAATTADPDTADYQGIVPGGVAPNTTYTIRIDTTQTAIATPEYQITTSDSGVGTTPDQNDSDGTTNGNYAQYSFTTGSSGHNDHTVDFGFSESALSLGNLVWEDANNNGVVDAGEPGIDGVTVQLYNDDGGMTGMYDGTNTLVASTSTAGGGAYLFNGLAAGDYVVVIPATDFASSAVLDGYTSSVGSYSSSGPYEGSATPDPDTDVDNNDNGTVKAGSAIAAAAVTLSDGDEPTDDGDSDTNSNFSVDFGFFIPAALGDYVWYDTDLDGQQDSDEGAVQGVTAELFIDADGDGVAEPNSDDGTPVATVTTDADGFYQFTHLPPGDYFVRFSDLPAGYFLTHNNLDSDNSDSDVHPTTATTPVYGLVAGQVLGTVDGGIQNSGQLASTGGDSRASVMVGVAIVVGVVSLVGMSRRRSALQAPLSRKKGS